MIITKAQRANVPPGMVWLSAFHWSDSSFLTCIKSMQGMVMRLHDWDPILSHCCFFDYPGLSWALCLGCSVDVNLMALMSAGVAHGYPNSDGILCFLESFQLPLLRGVTSLVLDRAPTIALNATLYGSSLIRSNTWRILHWHWFWSLYLLRFSNMDSINIKFIFIFI